MFLNKLWAPMISANNSPEVLHQGSPTVLSLLCWMFENIKRHLTSQASNLYLKSGAAALRTSISSTKSALCCCCRQDSRMFHQEQFVNATVHYPKIHHRFPLWRKRGWVSEREEKGKLLSERCMWEMTYLSLSEHSWSGQQMLAILIFFSKPVCVPLENIDV